MCSSKTIYTLEEIKEISQPVFEKYPTIKEAYLFGSYARGEATENSDLDFMIVLKDYEIESLKDELRVASNLEDVFKKQVDTLNEEDAMKIMPSSIERDGIKIYEQGNKSKM